MHYLNCDEKLGWFWFVYNFLWAGLFCCVAVFVGFWGASLFGYALFEVETNSMYPAFEAGDAVMIKKDCEVKVGDVVCFNHPLLGSVTHRVIDIRVENDNKLLLCCGDNLLYERGFDDWREAKWELETLNNEDAKKFANDIVLEKDVVGKVELIFKKGQIIFKILKFFAIFCSIFLIFLLNFKNNLKNKKFLFKK